MLLMTILPVGLLLYATFLLARRLQRNQRALSSLKFPGPWQAKFTSKWLLYKFSRGQHMNTVHSLHLRYGPVVQIGPRELSLCSASAAKAIYASNTPCTKGEIYKTMGRPGIFSFMDKEKHRERRRRITHIFAPKVLGELEPELQAHVERFVQMISKAAEEGRNMDIVAPLRMLALDIGGEVLLGQSFNALGTSPPPPYVRIMPYMHPVMALDREFPRMMALLRLIPFRPFQEFCGAVEYIYGYGEARMRDSIARFGRQSRRRDLLTKLIAGDLEKRTQPLTDQEIADEVSNFIYAAVDTTAVVTTYLVYELACNQDWQRRLSKELASERMRERGYPYQVLQGLPVLQAIVYETLRMHPPGAVGLPRLTPEEGIVIEGLHLPGKITVSAPTMTIQRNPIAFPEPDTFNPARWLSPAGSGTAMSPISPKDQRSFEYVFSPSPVMQAHMLPWGGGEHICAGQNMAMMEIKITAAKVFGEFAVRAADEQTHEDMKMQDHFVTEAKGGKGMFLFQKKER